ncbi:MAG: hypothetical protein ACR2PI_05570 [Hyphomicrobiaceae bacterium]
MVQERAFGLRLCRPRCVTHRALTAVCAGLGLVCAATTTAVAQTKQIAVKWDDPEIKRFQRRSRRRSLGASALFDPRLAKLKLPVLGYERTIPKVRSAFRVAPRARRTLTMDERNPVWYEIAYDYGEDIKVTVEADLRVQTRLPPGTKVYDKPRNFAVSQDSDISVFDGRSEVGMIGAIAEFKVYRFGQVPYSVTIECSEKKMAVCQDVDALKRDKRFLRLISARPPKP